MIFSPFSSAAVSHTTAACIRRAAEYPRRRLIHYNISRRHVHTLCPSASVFLSDPLPVFLPASPSARFLSVLFSPLRYCAPSNVVLCGFSFYFLWFFVIFLDSYVAILL